MLQTYTSYIHIELWRFVEAEQCDSENTSETTNARKLLEAHIKHGRQT